MSSAPPACEHESFCGTDDPVYVICEGCQQLFDAADVASHLSERLAESQRREREAVAALRMGWLTSHYAHWGEGGAGGTDE